MKINHGREVRRQRSRERSKLRIETQEAARLQQIVRQIVRILTEHGNKLEANHSFDAVRFLRSEGALGRRDHGIDLSKVNAFDIGYRQVSEALSHAVAENLILLEEIDGHLYYALPPASIELEAVSVVEDEVEAFDFDWPEVPVRFAHLQPGW